jgi:hypothetical protein
MRPLRQKSSRIRRLQCLPQLTQPDLSACPPPETSLLARTLGRPRPVSRTLAAPPIWSGGYYVYVAMPPFWTLPTAFLSGLGAAVGIAILSPTLAKPSRDIRCWR